MKEGTFHRLANVARRGIWCEKMIEASLGSCGNRVAILFAPEDFDKSRLLCKDSYYDASQQVLRSLVVFVGRYKKKNSLILISNGYPHLIPIHRRTN